MVIKTIWTGAEYGSIEQFKRLYTPECLNEQKEKKMGGQGLLHLAIRGRSIDVVRFLLEEGININQQDYKGQTCLHYLATKYIDRMEPVEFELAKLLLDNGIDIDIADNYGNTCLWTACHSSKGKDFSFVKLLMKYKPNVNHKNNVGKTPLDLAKDAGYKELIQILGDEG